MPAVECGLYRALVVVRSACRNQHERRRVRWQLTSDTSSDVRWAGCCRHARGASERRPEETAEASVACCSGGRRRGGGADEEAEKGGGGRSSRESTVIAFFDLLENYIVRDRQMRILRRRRVFATATPPSINLILS